MDQTPPARTPVNIEDEMKRSYMDYAMSVIIGRALPDVRDGLEGGEPGGAVRHAADGTGVEPAVSQGGEERRRGRSASTTRAGDAPELPNPRARQGYSHFTQRAATLGQQGQGHHRGFVRTGEPLLGRVLGHPRSPISRPAPSQGYR